jgi:hypothetical protein
LFDCYVAVSFSVRISYKMLGKSLPDLISWNVIPFNSIYEAMGALYIIMKMFFKVIS